MRFLAIDDERLALQMLTDTIREVVPDAELYAFLQVGELLNFVQQTPCDVAFLDIRMRSMTGLELARRLKDRCPGINIIFVTGYREYGCEAMNLHASGYIEKPVTPEKIRRELADLRYSVVTAVPQAILKVTCFGSFEVCTAREPIHAVHFDRAKSRECFAYLVSRCGSSCTPRELAGILFEDLPYDRKQANYMQQIITSMMRALREVGAEDVIRKSYNALAVEPTLLDCDYYRFREGEAASVNRYRGEFMQQYSWAEFITGSLK